jgi:hypothetical protein
VNSSRNRVAGSLNIIHQSHSNCIEGNYNRVILGDRNFVIGHNNTVNGDNNIVIGNNLIVGGDGNIVNRQIQDGNAASKQVQSNLIVQEKNGAIAIE